MADSSERQTLAYFAPKVLLQEVDDFRDWRLVSLILIFSAFPASLLWGAFRGPGLNAFDRLIFLFAAVAMVLLAFPVYRGWLRGTEIRQITTAGIDDATEHSPWGMIAEIGGYSDLRGVVVYYDVRTIRSEDPTRGTVHIMLERKRFGLISETRFRRFIQELTAIADALSETQIQPEPVENPYSST